MIVQLLLRKFLSILKTNPPLPPVDPYNENPLTDTGQTYTPFDARWLNLLSSTSKAINPLSSMYTDDFTKAINNILNPKPLLNKIFNQYVRGLL